MTINLYNSVTPTWAFDFAYRSFSSGPYMGEDGKKWIRSSRSWLRNFCKSIGATDMQFHKGHYEWSAFFLLNGQWWYLDSGDVRFKIQNCMLIRKTISNTDYSGGVNQFVPYNTDFYPQLLTILGLYP